MLDLQNVSNILNRLSNKYQSSMSSNMFNDRHVTQSIYQKF